ncbi:MAG: DUF3644 domain-containing protein [Acidobacteriota bacterium]
MRREARLLLHKAIDSLILAIECFNRPWDRGRITGTLILLDHSFEMLLKAAIIHKGGRIREPRATQTIGFGLAVRKCLTESKVKCLTDEQALSVQALNTLRDSAQHHLLDLSEQQLYLQAQSAVTLFRDLYKLIFGKDLADLLPERVLPVSTVPPTDIATLFDSEISEIRKLLQPKKRRLIDAKARLRALAILEGSAAGQQIQPSDRDLTKLANQVKTGLSWEKLFPGVASLTLTTEGVGPSLALRITKKEGVPIQLVKEGTPGAAVVAVKRVDELGFYSLGRNQLAKHIGLNGPQTTALIRHQKIEADSDCFKEVTIGKSKFKRYSQEAVKKLRAAKEKVDMKQVWKEFGPVRRA